MLKFVDVSHYQSTSQVSNALKSVDGIVIKASECLGVDAAHAGHVALARKARKLVGHYHYGWSGDAVAPQVAAFVKAAGALPGETLWLDHERTASGPKGQWAAKASDRVAFVLAFCAAVQKATGARCGLYVNKSEWSTLLAAATAAQKTQLLALPLWIAAPSDPAGKPAISGHWVLHQYGIVAGVDADVANCTPDSWRALGVPAPKPAVKPAPVPPKPVTAPVAKAPAPVAVTPTAPPSMADPGILGTTAPDQLLAGLHLPDLPRSVIRTVTPAIVGQVGGWLALAHVTLTPGQQAQEATVVGLVLGGAYYAGVRALERRWPSLGWLLGATGAPTYPVA